MVFDVLSNFYTALVRQSYAPKDMKRWVIVTYSREAINGKIIPTITAQLHCHLLYSNY